MGQTVSVETLELGWSELVARLIQEKREKLLLENLVFGQGMLVTGK